MDNLELWNKVCKTDPSHTSSFNNGRFKGTAIRPYWLIKRATEVFGPIGKKWGWEVQGDAVEGPEGASVWFSKVAVWYELGDEARVFWTPPQWGGTQLYHKNGIVDDEAAKKSVTDAVSKCLSYLGFGGDVHMGLFDDSKYVAEVQKEFTTAKKAAQKGAELEAELAAAETPEDIQVIRDSFTNYFAYLRQKNRDLFNEYDARIEEKLKSLEQNS